ncbi:MAG TPA: carboxypeptidase regulatory-like domain-containing protein [Thermoanaerobaculia bacterium]
MNLGSSMRGKLVVTALLFVVALPLAAAGGKRRSVQHPETTSLTAGLLAGTVLDETNNKPVVGAEIAAGTQLVSTDAQGHFEINVPAGTGALIVRRSGYEQKVLNAVSPNMTIRLKPTQTVAVRMNTGTNYQLDIESVQFAYMVPFSGYSRTNYAKFCRDGNTEYEPDRSEIKRITGPATPATNSACCPRPILSANVQLRSGETFTGYFIDNCFGYDVFIVGRDHVSGKFEYLNFAQIAEMVFP